MSYVHPAWLEHRRQRFERHDAHRFTKPEPMQRKSYAERLLETQRAAEWVSAWRFQSLSCISSAACRASR